MGRLADEQADALPYTGDEFVVDMINELGPEAAADIALRLLAFAIATGQLHMDALTRFAVAISRDAIKVQRHFLDAGARCGSFGLPRA